MKKYLLFTIIILCNLMVQAQKIDTISFSVDDVEENVSQINVYPNPAKDRVVIEGIEAAEVNVYNALGQVVKTVRGTNEIDLSGLVDGVYMLRIRDKEGRIFLEKVMVR